MIELHKLDNTTILLNFDQIESIEQAPDTIITLSNGKKIIVKDNAKEIIKKIINFKLKSVQEKFKNINALKAKTLTTA